MKDAGLMEIARNNRLNSHLSGEEQHEEAMNLVTCRTVEMVEELRELVEELQELHPSVCPNHAEAKELVLNEFEGLL